MFSAPWEDGGDFQLQAIAGIERFFAKLWRALQAPIEPGGASSSGGPPIDIGLHQLVHDVEQALEQLRFNVGIARLMAYLPSVRTGDTRSVYLRLLAPFAPHLAEELWARTGETFSVHTAAWPEYDATLLSSREVEWAVQVDGRVRDRLQLPADAGEEVVVRLALESEKVAAALGRKRPDRSVFVPGRLVNFVTGSAGKL